MPNKVFIINEGGHDYSSAKEFGELVIMTEGHIGRFKITSMARIFKSFLDTSSEDDYIVACGPALMLAIACSVFAANHKRLNLLIWQPDDAVGGRYICRKTIL